MTTVDGTRLRESWVLDISAESPNYALVTVATTAGDKVVYRVPRKTISAAIHEKKRRQASKGTE